MLAYRYNVPPIKPPKPAPAAEEPPDPSDAIDYQPPAIPQPRRKRANVSAVQPLTDADIDAMEAWQKR
jgi:hypothetical protein